MISSCARSSWNRDLSRRAFLRGAGALAGYGAMGWLPVFRIPPRGSRATLAPPAGFPAPVALYQQAYQNWSGEIRVQNVWTAAPRTPDEVVLIVNWAADHHWRVRPKGRSHGWSPLVLPQGGAGERYLLVDTTQHLTGFRIDPGRSPATVTAEAGLTLDLLLEELGAAGLGFANVPGTGSITLGGALAVGAHGSALPGREAALAPGQTFGSLTNAVLELTAVVWDGASGRYGLRTFRRDDPAIGPLLVHLGRTFLVSATLQVGADVNLRCVSHGNVPASQVFAPPGTAGEDSFGAWVRRHGRVQATWFPFTPCPWVKVWTVAPECPPGSRALEGPYPFTFSNWLTPAQSDFISQGLANDEAHTPTFQLLEMAAVEAGLLATGTLDVWGPSRRTSLHLKASTLRMAQSGHVVLTRAADVQRVVSEFHGAFSGLVARYAAMGLYPVNGPMDLRVTGLDRPDEVVQPGAVAPHLSALRPRPDHPAWDCAVTLDVLTLPGTLGAPSFFTDLETWILTNYTGDYAGVRVAWSKGWAYTPEGAWTSAHVLGQHIPASHTLGQDPAGAWPSTLSALDACDPHHLFSTPLLDTLMVVPGGSSVRP